MSGAVLFAALAFFAFGFGAGWFVRDVTYAAEDRAAAKREGEE